MAEISQGPVLAPTISNSGLLGVLWSGAAFSVVVVTIRVIVRCKLFGRLKVDDYFVLAALVFCLGSTITWTVLSKNLYLALPGERESFTIDLAEYLEKIATGVNANLASYILSYSALWSIKFSFMAFFKPLGQQLRSQQILWWISLAFILASYIVCVGLLDYRCLSSNGLTVLANCTSQKVADYSYAGVRVTTSLDIFSDVLIVAVSANIVYRASIPWRKKLVLTLICSLTTVMIVAAIIRITVGAHGQDPDLSWLLVWNSIEITLAIFVACIASFRSLYCHTKHSRPVEQRITQPLKKPSARNFLESTFGTDTILSSEQSQWIRQPSEDSRVGIWVSRDFDTGIEAVEMQKPAKTTQIWGA